MAHIYHKIVFISLALLGSIQIANAAFFNDPSLKWQTLSTPHFNIHFHDKEKDLALKTAILAERTHLRLSKFFNWRPTRPTELVLTDRVDFSNGSATPLPRNTMNIIVSPPDDIGVLDDYDDWLDLLIMHEYTHILHLDKSLGFSYMLRSVFGRLFGLFPNAFQPPWGVEGLATYMETDFEKGVGRGQSSSFRALMRMEVESGVKSIRQVNQPMVSWPAGTARYLYGVYFYQYIAEHYGQERIQRWTTFYSARFFPYFINNNAKETFNKKDMTEMWALFSKDLETKFQPEIDAIEAKGIVKGENISNAGYYTGNPRALANGDVYFVQNDFESHNKLMLLRKGTDQAIKFTDTNSERFDIHPEAGIVIAQIDAIKSVNYFSDLYIIDLHSSKITRITHGKRYTYATWSPDGSQIVAVQNHEGNKSLHLLKNTGEYIETLWQGHNKEVISQPDWAPDGKSIVAAVWRQNTQWNIEQFYLTDKSWRSLTSTGNIEAEPQFSADGTSILFCADYNGVYNVHRMTLANGKITTLTNLIGGAIAATQVPGSKDIYYMGISAHGYDVYRLNNAHDTAVPLNINSVIKIADSGNAKDNTATQQNQEIAPTTLASYESSIKSYSGLDKLKPTSWFPVLSVSDESMEIGVATTGSDPLNRHNYAGALVIDPINRWLLGEVDYVYDRWNPSLKFYANRRPTTFLNNDNEFNRIRISSTYTFELIFPQLKRDRQLSYHAAILSDTEADKKLAEGAQPATSTKDNLLGLALSYNSAFFYPRAISLSDGQRFSLIAEDSDTLSGDYSGQVYSLDWRGYLTLHRRQVLATRFAFGWGTDQPNPFKLGGNSEGYYLASPGDSLFAPTRVIFAKRSYSLRGFPEGLASARGRRMSLAELEYRFPIALIERGFMTPPIGVHDIYGKIFYNTGEAWYDNFDSSSLLHGVGFEVNTQFVFGYFFGLNLRVGYAHGFGSLGEDQFYLKFGGTY